MRSKPSGRNVQDNLDYNTVCSWPGTRLAIHCVCASQFLHDLRIAAAGFYIFTVMAHICTSCASHCVVSSIPHICLPTTLPAHAQDSAATCTPTFLNSRYFLSRPRKAWNTGAKQFTTCRAQSRPRL